MAAHAQEPAPPAARHAGTGCRLFELYAQRDPLYREVADHVVVHRSRGVIARFAASLEGERARTCSASVMRRCATVTVALGERSYPIHIGAGTALAPGALRRASSPRRAR